MFYPDPFDVIIIGGGHAGTEAAMARAYGSTDSAFDTQYRHSGADELQPGDGGIGKGHLVKEVDALGGLMAKAMNQAGIQFRILNASKGPAVRATRAQADRVLYRQAVRTALENQPNLMIFQQAVEDYCRKRLRGRCCYPNGTEVPCQSRRAHRWDVPRR